MEVEAIVSIRKQLIMVSSNIAHCIHMSFLSLVILPFSPGQLISDAEVLNVIPWQLIIICNRINIKWIWKVLCPKSHVVSYKKNLSFLKVPLSTLGVYRCTSKAYAGIIVVILHEWCEMGIINTTVHCISTGTRYLATSRSYATSNLSWRMSFCFLVLKLIG